MSDRRTIEAAEIVSRAYEGIYAASRLTTAEARVRSGTLHTTRGGRMDTGTFYATTSAVSFTLLGFWWVVVQFRHNEMTQDPAGAGWPSSCPSTSSCPA